MEVKRTEIFKKQLTLKLLDLELNYTEVPSDSSLQTNLLFDEHKFYPLELVREIMQLLSKHDFIKNISVDFHETNIEGISCKEIETNAPERIDLVQPHRVHDYVITHLETLDLDLEERDNKLSKTKGITCQSYCDMKTVKGFLPKNIEIDTQSKTALITMNPYLELHKKGKFDYLSHFFWIDHRRPVFLQLFNQLLLDSNVEEIIIEYFYDKNFEDEKEIPNSMKQIKALIDKGLTKSVIIYYTENAN